jgi:hypothetical protein
MQTMSVFFLILTYKSSMAMKIAVDSNDGYMCNLPCHSDQDCNFSYTIKWIFIVCSIFF